MKNQILRQKKLAKKKKTWKDYKKRKNINKNASSEFIVIDRPIYKSETSEYGNVYKTQIGTRKKRIRVRKHIPIIQFPKSKKYKK